MGTKVGVSADAPWTDCVYKLVEYRGLPTLKLSTGKRSLPGPKQVFRYRDQSGDYLRDVIGLAIEPTPDRDGEPLLKDVMRGGRLTNQHPPLEELRERFARDFAHLPETHKALRSPATYDVRYSQGLTDLQATAEAEIRERELGQ